MIRAVVDTNVVVSGILDRAGAPAAVLRAAGLRYEQVWTPAIAVECRRILDLLGGVRVVESDPDDDVLFAAALAAGARTIVSGDAAVLAVGSFAGVMVVGAAKFLATLGED